MSEQNESVIPASFQQSVIETFKTQVGIDVEIDRVTTHAGGEESNTGIECMSVIGLKCSTHTGSFALGFPSTTYLKVLEKMLGEKQAEISSANIDGCGEILNIIYASARVKINQAGFNFEPAIPTTIRGKDLSIILTGTGKYLRIAFKCEYGAFFIGLNLKSAAKG